MKSSHWYLAPAWPAAIPIFRLMTPTILVFGIINPLFWVMASMGLQKRSLYVGLVLAPLVVAAYLLGVRYGPNGVALSYSTVMVLWLFPHVAWCLYGTPISIADLAKADSRALRGRYRGSGMCVRAVASDRSVTSRSGAACDRRRHDGRRLWMDTALCGGLSIALWKRHCGPGTAFQPRSLTNPCVPLAVGSATEWRPRDATGGTRACGRRNSPTFGGSKLGRVADAGAAGTAC